MEFTSGYHTALFCYVITIRVDDVFTSSHWETGLAQILYSFHGVFVGFRLTTAVFK